MNFTLEKFHECHIQDIAQHANNEKIASKLRDVFPYPYTIDDASWYLNDCISKEGHNQICRAIVVEGKAVGSIGIFMKDDVYQKSAELGYWLGEAYWGHSIMSEAAKLLCKEAFEVFPIVRIFAEPFAHNTGSRRVLEKAGFTLEGIMKSSVFKCGEIHDSCMYALLRQ